MNRDLIEKLVELTGKTADEINQILDGLTMEAMYNIIDLSNKGKTEELVQLINNTVEESMSKKKAPTSGTVPKPRDPMAKALALPQNQHKVTPNRKERLAKMASKHKGRTGDDASASFAAEGVVNEGFMSMTAMPSIQRMLELAGRPSDEESVLTAMEDIFQVQDTPKMDFSKYGIDTVPTGTKLIPGLVNLDTPATDDVEVDIIPVEPEAEEAQEESGDSLPFKEIQDAAQAIKSRVLEVKIGEAQEVKRLINELNSAIDSVLDNLGN